MRNVSLPEAPFEATTEAKTGLQVYAACLECADALPAAAPSDSRAHADWLREHYHFALVHRTHRRAWLRPAETVISDLPLWDPMARVVRQARAGGEDFLITSFRRSIDEPRLHRVTRGSLHESAARVTFDADLIARGLRALFPSRVAAASKIDSFLRIVQSSVERLASKNLEILYDDAESPGCEVARVPDSVFRQAIWAAHEIFDRAEAELVDRFLSDNRSDDGAFQLLVHRDHECRHRAPATAGDSALAAQPF